MHLFLTSSTDCTYATLPPDESKHCIRVLRMLPGDEIWVTSGDGVLCTARITKNNARLEWFVEKAVEIGIDRITPLICQHSERVSLNIDRLRKIALSAMKQSLQASIPQIDSPTPINKLLSEPIPPCSFICHCAEGERHTLNQLYTPGSDVLVLIGPEGDFSPDEITRCNQLGFRPVTLGDHRLRTETAALYALTALNILNNQ